MSEVMARTMETFDRTYNCAQSVFSAYCEQLGVDRETGMKIARAFGAGMGRQGETCGAVSGAYLLIGLAHSGEEKEAKEQSYAMVQEFARRFKERRQTTICREILGVDTLIGNQDVLNGKYKPLCADVVRDAVEIVAELLGL